MQVDAIRFLVQAGCPASVQDNVASTPLHIAAGEGHIEAIKVLKSLVYTLLQKSTLQASLKSMLGIVVCKIQRCKAASDVPWRPRQHFSCMQCHAVSAPKYLCSAHRAASRM